MCPQLSIVVTVLIDHRPSQLSMEIVPQSQCKQQVSQEQALRRRAELQMQEAIKEVASSTKDKQLAELQAEDARRLLELEVKLRTQLAHEKDQARLLDNVDAVSRCGRNPRGSRRVAMATELEARSKL